MIIDPLPDSAATQSTNASPSDFLVWKYGKSATTPSDELERYLRADREMDPGLDVHAWWMNHQTQYPLLFRIAMDIMSIPATSSEVERIFSG